MKFFWCKNEFGATTFDHLYILGNKDGHWSDKICHYIREAFWVLLTVTTLGLYYLWLGIVFSLIFDWCWEFIYDCNINPERTGASKYDIISGELGTLTMAMLIQIGLWIHGYSI